MSIAAVRTKCFELEFTEQDTKTLVGLVRQAQTRHVFRPEPRYKDYEYPYPMTR